jgi:hypothetical protein
MFNVMPSHKQSNLTFSSSSFFLKVGALQNSAQNSAKRWSDESGHLASCHYLDYLARFAHTACPNMVGCGIDAAHTHLFIMIDAAQPTQT